MSRKLQRKFICIQEKREGAKKNSWFGANSLKSLENFHVEKNVFKAVDNWRVFTFIWAIGSSAKEWLPRGCCHDRKTVLLWAALWDNRVSEIAPGLISPSTPGISSTPDTSELGICEVHTFLPYVYSSQLTSVKAYCIHRSAHHS